MKLSKTQSLITSEERGRTKVVPYAFVIGSIRYAMLSTAPDLCLATCLARGYKGDPGVDHWTVVKIVLRGIRKYFSVMEVIKSSTRVTSMQALTPIQMTMSRKTGYV